MSTKKGQQLPGNLPSPLSSFVGRQRELVEVKRVLAGQRLLTLTGTGGSGKTRLAIRAAGELSAAYPDGVWFVELASLSEPGLVAQALATILSIRPETAIPLVTTLSVHLRTSQTLLVLDNCEHLIDACAHLCQTLLENCPRVRLLATSREPLGVPGEVVRLVPPLTLPNPQPWQGPTNQEISLSAYQQSEAIQLFVERASAVSPHFSLTTQNAAWVANICRHLDGIPLAIELAATRVRAFSPHQIANLLEKRQNDRFQLLTGGLRTAPARQQTMEATLDWSHALLSNADQVIFRRLSVFSGGWSMQAAGEVCFAADDESSAVAILSNLIDKSLVAVDHFQDQSRYRYLETIRQYAWQKLVEAGETEFMRDRHLRYFTQWAEQAEFSNRRSRSA